MIDFSKALEESKLDKERFYLLVAGSRGFGMNGAMSYPQNGTYVIIDNYDIFRALLDRCLSNVVQKYKEVRVFYGDARGVDAMAKRYAKEHSYVGKEFKANWDSEGRRAGMLRNQTMYTHLSLHENRAAILIWDGESRGTRNNFLLAENYATKVICYNYMLQRWMTKEEIAEVTEKVASESRYYY